MGKSFEDRMAHKLIPDPRWTSRDGFVSPHATSSDHRKRLMVIAKRRQQVFKIVEDSLNDPTFPPRLRSLFEGIGAWLRHRPGVNPSKRQVQTLMRFGTLHCACGQIATCAVSLQGYCDQHRKQAEMNLLTTVNTPKEIETKEFVAAQKKTDDHLLHVVELRKAKKRRRK